MQIPRGSVKTDWEVELGVVIGQGGRYIAEADAMRHVAGYCVINDVSQREFQIERSGTWDKGNGHRPPVYLRAGQTMHLGVQGLGTQTQRVVQA